MPSMKTCEHHSELEQQVGRLDRSVSKTMGGIRVIAVIVALASAMMAYAATTATNAARDVQVHRAEGNEFKERVLSDLSEIKAEIRRNGSGGQ